MKIQEQLIIFFSETNEPDVSDNAAGTTFNYEGVRNRQSKSQKQGPSFYEIASDMAGPYMEKGAVEPNVPVIKASEVYFLRAESTLAGWQWAVLLKVFM